MSAVTRAGIELGVSLLPDGQRKRGLHLAATAMFTEEFAGRCLPFDERTASRYASIVASRTRIGLPISVKDAQIASIALVHGLTLATRNESDFDLIEDLAQVNPWSAVA